VGSFGGSGSLLKTKIIFVNEFSRSSVTMTVMTVVEYPQIIFNGIPPNNLFSQSLLQLFPIFEEKNAYKPIHCKKNKKLQT
jgi:hypothetical protein